MFERSKILVYIKEIRSHP